MIRVIFFRIILVMFGFLGWLYLIRSEPIRFGAISSPQTANMGIIAYGFVLTLVGVLLGSIYRALQKRLTFSDTIGDVKEFSKYVFSSIDLWMGLCGAPLVYAMLWKSLDGGGIAGLTVVALQNGFCCSVIIGGLMPNSNSSSSNQEEDSLSS